MPRTLLTLLTSLGHECVEAAPPVNGEKIALSFFTTYCAGVAGGCEGPHPYPDEEPVGQEQR